MVHHICYSSYNWLTQWPNLRWRYGCPSGFRRRYQKKKKKRKIKDLKNFCVSWKLSCWLSQWKNPSNLQVDSITSNGPSNGIDSTSNFGALRYDSFRVFYGKKNPPPFKALQGRYSQSKKVLHPLLDIAHHLSLLFLWLPEWLLKFITDLPESILNIASCKF